MDESELKTESACVCGKCCSAVFPFFSISNYEFKSLFNINSAIDQNRYDEYVSLFKLSRLIANLNKNDFFTVHLNTRSLSKNKIDDFLINTERMPDVIAIFETKLNANSFLNLNFTNYKFICNDSITHAGGIGLYKKDSLRFTLRKDLSLNLQHCEDLWLEVESEKSSFILGVIYSYPKQKISLFQDKLSKNFSKLENNKLNYIVNGDFNINTLAIKNLVRNYVNDLNSIGCKMLINISTRFAENCKSSLLDHVYTNMTNENIKSEICISEISDHFSTFFIAHRSKILHYNKTKFIRSVKQFQSKDFLLDLRNDLSKLNLKPNKSSVNQDVINLTTVFNSVLDRHAPMRPMSRKEKRLTDKPWITKEILTSIKTQNRLYKKIL